MAMLVAAVNGHRWKSCVTTVIRWRKAKKSRVDSGRPFQAAV
jgi:hypothetical protein